MRLVLATQNAHKIKEIRAVLAGSGLEVLGLDAVPDLPDELPETGATFEENALQKARFIFDRTGLATLADDSGIEIWALGWAPGVNSKRWTPEATDEANNRRLLFELGDGEDRRARYRCALAVVAPAPAAGAGDPVVHGVVDGICAGHIGRTPRGTGGFGYDPLFWPDDAPGRTMAELSMAEKNAISHRGRALERLPALLGDLGLL